MTKLTELVVNYKKTKDEKYLKEILVHAAKLVNKKLGTIVIPNIIKEEIMDEALSVVLLRSIKQFRKNKNVNFSTFFFNKIKSLIYDSFAYHHAQKREDKGIYTIDELEDPYSNRIDIFQVIESKDENLVNEMIYDDLINEMNKILSKRAKRLLKLLSEGHNKFAAFRKMGFENWKDQKHKNKLIEEIQNAYRKVNE